MNTTAVFAEVLAIGIESMLVLALALATVFDLTPFVSVASTWEALATVAALALAYVLGVAVDRIADSVLSPLRNRGSGRDRELLAERRRQVLEKPSPLSVFLEYQRSRMRLMRGTVANLAIAVPVTAAFGLRASWDAGTVLTTIGVLVGAIVACWYAYLRIGMAQDQWLERVQSAHANLPSSREAAE